MGGFGSAVLELLAELGRQRPGALPRGARPLVEHGDPDRQHAAFGLDAAGIARAVRRLLAGVAERRGRRSRAAAERLDERCVREGLAESRTPRAGADPRRPRARRRRARGEARHPRARRGARARARRGRGASSSRGGEKLAGRARRSRRRSAPAACASTSAPRRAASPTACSRRARAASSRSTSATASSIRGCATIRASPCSSAERPHPGGRGGPRGGGRRDRARRDRRLVHLARRSCCRASPSSRPRAELLVLVKPQFEVGPEQVGKGGVVRDDALRAAAVARVRDAAAALGLSGRGRGGEPARRPQGEPRDLPVAPSPRGAHRGPDWYGFRGWARLSRSECPGDLATPCPS